MCVHSRSLWVSPMNSPVRLRVSAADASTPTGVFNQWFETVFPPRRSPGLRSLSQSPVVPPSLSTHECGTAQSSSHHIAESSPPSCPSPSLLPIWVNVASLSPWLSDFHTVLSSVSSGCFLFLNCCCPSFGCARRHSVSTYASILAGSPATGLS